MNISKQLLTDRVTKILKAYFGQPLTEDLINTMVSHLVESLEREEHSNGHKDKDTDIEPDTNRN